MRNFLKKGATAMAAILIGSTALATAPAFATSNGVQMAQAERGEGGGRPEGARGGGPRNGGAGTERRGSPAAQPGGGAVQERTAPRSGGGMAQERIAPRRDGGAVQNDRRSTVRRDEAPSRRVTRGEQYDRRDQGRSGYRAPFVTLGGPRMVVRGYGPGWCRGLHRGWHRAPGLGWHGGAHRGLFRC